MNEAINLTTTTSKGHTYWVLRWRGADGKHHGKTIGRIDKVSKRQAEKKRVEKINELAKQPGRRNISRSPLLEDYLNSYYEARKTEISEGTMTLHKQTGKYLTAFFGKNRRLDSIQRADARAFKTALANGDLKFINKRKRDNMKPSTISLNIRNARTIFSKAVDDDLILFNPFDKIAETQTFSKEWHFVDMDEFHKLMNAANPSWKLMFALTRLAGLRRGEALNLRWSQIDWESSRLTVIANDEWKPKDKDSRIVPIVPELYEILLKAFEDAKEGDEHVIKPGNINIRNISRDFNVICKKAVVDRYDKPTHTLRKSCLTDWAGKFPAHVVKEWAGHSSIETTDEFYLKVNEADYLKAAGKPTEDCTQLCTQPDKKGEKETQDEKQSSRQDAVNKEVTNKAGDEIRTLDVQLGKLAFYH